jgi:putative hemolysin
MAQLGRIPVTGDSFELKEVKFEFLDMDGMRVDKILVTPPIEDKGDAAYSI